MILVPYKLLTRACPVVDGTISVPKEVLDFLLSKLLAHAAFDEKGYLRTNPDVAAAVRKGEWGSAQEHFAASGYFEDRRGGTLEVSESWYAKVNPDVARAVMAGEWPSGAAHYEQQGVYEWRSPNKEAAPHFLLWKELLKIDQGISARGADPAAVPDTLEPEQRGSVEEKALGQAVDLS